MFVVDIYFSQLSSQWRRFQVSFSDRVWAVQQLLNQLDKGLTAHCKLHRAWDRNLHRQRCPIQDNQRCSSHRCLIKEASVEAVTATQICCQGSASVCAAAHSGREGSESRGRGYSEKRDRRRDQTHSPMPSALRMSQNVMDQDDAKDQIEHRIRTIENLLRTHAQGMAAWNAEQQQIKP